MAKGLGKGLDALFEDTEAAYEKAFEQHRSVFEYTEEERKNAEEMPLNKISANPNQPRKNFDEQALKELSDSIRKHGVIMPIVVNDNGDGSYMIIAGERRFRACKLAGKETIPVVIRKYSAREIKEISLISRGEYCLITTGIEFLPASLHARKRRSPAIIIYVPSLLSLTTIGIITPCC